MKVGFLITARLKSTRLPLKLLKDLHGKTVIERVIERAKQVNDIAEIVLCTSTNPQDKPLVDIARRTGIYYYNGHEEDVLQRLSDVARFFNMDYFISITADNPLFSIDHANLSVDILKREHKDFVKTSGLPLGAAVYGLKAQAVEVVCTFKHILDTEMWGYLIDRPELFDVAEIQARGPLNRPDLRLTLDYEEDYRLIKDIYSHFPSGDAINLYEALEYLSANPAVGNINKNCVQLGLDAAARSAIDAVFHTRKQELLRFKNDVYQREA